MKNIFVIGAGLSASSLLRYLTENASLENWQIKVCDRDGELAQSKVDDCENAMGFELDALNPDARKPYMEWADLVISMLPARFHIEIAKDCLKFNTNLITPSYVSKEMKELDEAAKAAVRTIETLSDQETRLAAEIAAARTSIANLEQQDAATFTQAAIDKGIAVKVMNVVRKFRRKINRIKMTNKPPSTMAS